MYELFSHAALYALGVGLTSPDPSMTIKTEQDVEIPLGTPVETKMKNSSLLYNEYPFT